MSEAFPEPTGLPEVRTVTVDPRRVFLVAWMAAIAIVGAAAAALGAIGVLALLDVPGRPFAGIIDPRVAAPIGGVGIGIALTVAVCIAAATFEYRRIGAHHDDRPHRQTHTIEQRAIAIVQQVRLSPIATSTPQQWDHLHHSVTARLAAGMPLATGAPLVADVIELLDSSAPTGIAATKRLRMNRHVALRADLMIIDAGLNSPGEDAAA